MHYLTCPIIMVSVKLDFVAFGDGFPLDDEFVLNWQLFIIAFGLLWCLPELFNVFGELKAENNVSMEHSSSLVPPFTPAIAKSGPIVLAVTKGEISAARWSVVQWICFKNRLIKKNYNFYKNN